MMLSVDYAGPDYKIDEFGRPVGPSGLLDPLLNEENPAAEEPL